ncbi:hypothetical protein [Streptomyces xiaopingdaonensis]|uniref:hypothetical protein n=1 Tax=Streptomyces xiaopingdaonensis TaxID=1565415 RepID=UPI0002D39BC6|nr:hypothetical protein [Streptomyces xiaopingdaonensis]
MRSRRIALTATTLALAGTLGLGTAAAATPPQQPGMADETFQPKEGGGFASLQEAGGGFLRHSVCDTKADGRGVYSNVKSQGGKVYGEVGISGAQKCTNKSYSIPKGTKIHVKVCHRQAGEPLRNCNTYTRTR